MRILNVLEGMFLAGSETHVYTNCMAATFATHGVFSLLEPFIDNDFSPNFLEAGIPVYYSDFDVIREDYDLVHFYGIDEPLLFDNANNCIIDRMGPAVWTMTFNSKAPRSKVPILCTSFRGLLMQSPENESYLYRTAVDPDRFKPEGVIAHDGVNLIRFCRQAKSEKILDEVVAEVCDEYDNVELTVLGEHDVETYGVAHPKLHYLGRVPDIRPYLHKSDIFVYAPKTTEDCSCDIAILEAMAVGIPVLSTRAWQVMEQMEHGETGIIVESDKREIKDGLKYLINHPDERNRMGANAAERVKAKFDISLRMPILKSLYEREIAKGSIVHDSQ